MAILINRFDGGLVDFMSARDLSAKQFQRLENMRINRVSRLVKRPGEGARTAESATALQVLPGMGHIQYRAERDASNVHVNSHFRTISLIDISGTPVVSIRRNNSINDDTGTFTEFLGSTVWTLRQVVGSSNISFSGNEITKASGFDVFFPGDLLRVYGSGEDNDGYVHVISATATTITVVEDLTTASNTSAVLIAFPHVSMYAINGVLRVSDGVFADTAPSQWYGHIKRDFWGEVVGVAENLSETAFATHADWDVTGVADDSGGNCAFVFAGGTLNGTLIQTAANRAETAENSKGYSFTYTIAVTTAPDNDFTLVLSAFSSASVSLPVTAGIHTVYFTSAADASTAAFTITAAETTSTQGSFTMDTVSLQRSRYGLNSGRYVAPPMQESYNSYLLKAQELVAPTIVAGSRVGDATSAANEVAIHIAGAHHEFVELMPNSIDRTFTGGSTAWANGNLNAFNETTDLTITATVADTYCTLLVASAPMTAARKYKLQFDVANLISTWTIQDWGGTQKFGTVRANGKEQSIKFTVDTAITGGLRLVADTDDASADFDNFSLSSIDWPEKAVDVEWNERDRVTATYVYDHVQETALGRTSSGEIGIPMGTIIGEDIARAFMVEAYTGAAQASWNRRITAIRLYYKFHDDPDWYEVVTLDINKGWSESELVFDAENTGYWQPIMAAIQHTETSDDTGGSGTTLESDAHALSIYDLISIGSTTVIEPDSMCSIVESQITDTITLPAAAVNSLGISTTYDAQPWCGGAASTTAVATFYIPFTGEKAFTYNTNTGRAAKLKVPAARWRTAATDGTSVLIGNIDTKDENDQTVREHSRVIETPAGMPDTFLLSKSKDVGIFEGDEIMAIADYQNNWWVMKERNIHVLQKGTLRTLAQFKGIGCRWMHAFVVTPWGLCVADEAGIFLLPSGEELSFPVRGTYQALTFFNPILTYSHLNKQLHFVPDTSSVTSAMLTFDMQNKGWMKDSFPAKTSLSNFAEGRHYEPEVMFEDGDPTLNLILNGDLFTGATGSTAPDGWVADTDDMTYSIEDLSGVANFDADTLQMVQAMAVAGGRRTQNIGITVGDGINYFTSYPLKSGKVFRVTFAYRFDKTGTANGKVYIGETETTELTDTGLGATDASLYSEDVIAVWTTSAILLILKIAKGTTQIDNIIVTQLNSYHVKQLNKGTTDETGLIQTGDIVLGNDPVLIRNAYITYLSSSVDVTVKVYLDNNALPAKTMTLDASSTLRNKVPILLNTTSEVLSLSFESTATDFTIEDIEIPDTEINPTD